MNKILLGAIAAFFMIFIIAAFWSGSKHAGSDNERRAVQNSASSPDQGISQGAIVMPEKDIVQVYLFHSTQRCGTCIAIGELARETINEHYQSELREGRVEFREINIDLPESRALAEKFQASGSALYINDYAGGKDNIKEDVKVWRLTDDESGFKKYLKGEIDRLLGK